MFQQIRRSVSAGAMVLALFAGAAFPAAAPGQPPAKENDDDNRERLDNPSQAAAFRKLVVSGGKKAVIPDDALPKAIERVRQLRSAAAANFKIKPGAMGMLGLAGQPKTVGGIPVGELHGDVDVKGVKVLPAIHPLAAAAGINPAGWQWVGPGNIGGRTRSFVIHPTSPSIIYVGGVAGGVWKTTNAGVTWSPLYDLMANVAITSLALDPNNPNVVFAGTGEGFFNLDAVRGFGIFRTADGGVTWNQLAATAGANADKFRYINRLAVASTGPKTSLMLVATRQGLFLSPDGGKTFKAVLQQEVLDVRFHPTDAQQAVAGARNGKSFYSTDGGQNWNASLGIATVPQFGGRVELAYAKANPKVVYASVDDGNGVIYRSLDGGKKFTKRSAPGHLAGQGWYANCLWAGDPQNPNFLVVGGLDLYRSTNAGATFTKISVWQNSPQSAHADHHAIVAHPAYNGTTNKTVYFGNDGGMYRAADVATVQGSTGWQELNNGLGITQFYGAAANLATGKLVGGTQDNGTLFNVPPLNTDAWKEVFGGDGGDAAADPVQEFYYGEYVYLQIHRSQAGNPSQYIFNGIADAGNENRALFIAPFILDPNNSNRMLGGAADLWLSKNVKQSPPTWRSIKASISGSLISAIAVPKGDSKTAWVGYDGGGVFKTANATSTTPSWSAVGAGIPDRYVSRIVFDDSSPKIVYVTLTGYAKDNLYKSTDAGATWKALGVGALPEVPFYDVAIHPDNPKNVYLGTEVGFFVSDNGGNSWFPTSQGPTNAPVSRMFWVNKNLHVATHGRGIFRINLAAPSPVTVPVPIAPVDDDTP